MATARSGRWFVNTDKSTARQTIEINVHISIEGARISGFDAVGHCKIDGLHSEARQRNGSEHLQDEHGPGCWKTMIADDGCRRLGSFSGSEEMERRKTGASTRWLAFYSHLLEV